MRLPPAVLYHAVCAPPATATGLERTIFLTPERFADQLCDLSRRGFRSLTLGEYAAALDGHTIPSKTMLLTFDDAYTHVAEVATPILRYHGFTAVMFAPVAHLSGRNTWDSAASPNLAELEIATPQQLQALDPSVWEVGSHGLRHVDLRRLLSDERHLELEAARERLSELMQRPIVDLAYPFGAHDASVRRDAERAGFHRAFAAGFASALDRFQLPRWPISGDDSLEMFRLKTSAWSSSFYRAYDLAPRWVRRRATTLLRKAVAESGVQ